MMEYIFPAIALIAAVVSTGFAISAIRLARYSEDMALLARSKANEAGRLVESMEKAQKKKGKRRDETR